MSEVKRMRYFKEEFLKNEDFTDEQEYHRQMRYRHNQDFHTWGIGDGLEVTFTPGDHSVNISPGIAIDGEGKEIVLGESRILDFNEAGYEGGKSYYITIIWSQEEGEPRQENEAKRWVETPEINTSETLPAQPELALVLALVTLNPDRTIAAVDDSIRRHSQGVIPDGSVTEAKLADNAVTGAKIADKTVTRAKIGDGSVNEEKLSTSVQAKLVTNGDNHTHSAGDVGALPDTGGTVNGNLQVNGDVNITNVIDFGDKTDYNDHWRIAHQGGDLVMYRSVSGTYVGPYLTITTGGNVGIGPGGGLPEETLHVNGSLRGNQEGGALRINTSNGYVDIGSQDQNNTHFMTDRETFYFNKRIMVDGGEIGSSSGQDLKLQTGGETKVTIKQDNGNVGIGTNTPIAKLDVNGDINCGGRIKAQNSRVIVTAENSIFTEERDWTDLPDMSIGITTGNNILLILFKGGGVQATGTSPARATFRILIDGQQKCFTLHEFHNIGGYELRDVTLHWMGSLSAGTHNIKVQWLLRDGHNLGCCWQNDTRSLIAIEL